MRYVKEFAAVLALLMLAGCAGKPVQESPVATDEGIPAGQIYLYGEIHGIAAIEEYEAERWKECYERGMRHLFVELSHYTAQWLNLWMDAEDDEILEQLHQDWESTLSSGAETLDFYRTIKEQCPETVFHGTDVGHQYDSTGARYQDYLEERGLADTEDYRLTWRPSSRGKPLPSVAPIFTGKTGWQRTSSGSLTPWMGRASWASMARPTPTRMPWRTPREPSPPWPLSW